MKTDKQRLNDLEKKVMQNRAGVIVCYAAMLLLSATTAYHIGFLM